MRHRVGVVVGVLVASVAGAATVSAYPVGGNVRLSNDAGAVNAPGPYINQYDFLHPGATSDDPTINECSRARGRQNEPSVAIDPRNTSVIVGSANDYCGVYNDGSDADGAPIPAGPIWLGYYRSENGGVSFQSSLVPGHPGDTSPYAALSQIRTASAGDPVEAWDNHGRLFIGSESSDDPAGTKKSFGDVFVATFVNSSGGTVNDGKQFQGSTIVARGTSAPNLLGKFNDKTAIEVDRTGGPCDGNVYFANSTFHGNGGGVAIDFSRSTDHGRTFSHGIKLNSSIPDVQFPDIAVTGNGHVYVTFRQFASPRGHTPDALVYARSVDCGRTFSPARVITTFTPYDAVDVASPSPQPIITGIDDPAGEDDTPLAAGSNARDCGDFASACQSGYTFFRRDTQVRSTADQGVAGDYVYLVYDPSKPGTEVATGTTYGSITPGVGSQSGIYYIRLDGATGASSMPTLIDNQAVGHQLFPDITASAGKLHVLWWDSRHDPSYASDGGKRPIGNYPDGTIALQALDVYATSGAESASPTWATATRMTSVASNPNWEQFGGRTAPFAGDYLWIDSVGSTVFGTWTDWRNTVAGVDQREGNDGSEGADVHQCRSQPSPGVFTGDTCPRDGGLNQDIYGSVIP